LSPSRVVKLGISGHATHVRRREQRAITPMTRKHGGSARDLA
jgi:hypothetical protein